MTADLEYFKCDVCGVYMHKDIFCDHRRDCKGLNSQELKRSECRVIAEELNEDTRRLVAQKDMAASSSIGGKTPALAGSVKAHLPVDTLEKRSLTKLRHSIAEEYQNTVDQEFESKYSEEKMQALMDFLKE